MNLCAALQDNYVVDEHFPAFQIYCLFLRDPSQRMGQTRRGRGVDV
jgi:hypothetical protein